MKKWSIILLAMLVSTTALSEDKDGTSRSMGGGNGPPPITVGQVLGSNATPAAEWETIAGGSGNCHIIYNGVGSYTLECPGYVGGGGGGPPAPGSIVDEMLASSYSGVGACPNGEFVNILNRDAAPGCATPAGGGAFLPLTGGTLSGPGNLTIAGTLTQQGVAVFSNTVTLNANAAAPLQATPLQQVQALIAAIPPPVIPPPANGSITDAMLANAYSGVGPCPTDEFVSALNRNAAPTCEALPVSGGVGYPAGAPPQIGGFSATDIPEAETVTGDLTFARAGANSYTATVTGVNGVAGPFAPLTNPTNGQNNYAPLAGPTFSGVPTMPVLQTSSNNVSQILFAPAGSQQGSITSGTTIGVFLTQGARYASGAWTSTNTTSTAVGIQGGNINFYSDTGIPILTNFAPTLIGRIGPGGTNLPGPLTVDGNPVGGPPANGSITDAMLANAYSGVGACPNGEFVNTLNRNAAPACAAPAAGGGPWLPVNNPTYTGLLSGTPTAATANQIAAFGPGSLNATTLAGQAFNIGTGAHQVNGQWIADLANASGITTTGAVFRIWSNGSNTLTPGNPFTPTPVISVTGTGVTFNIPPIVDPIATFSTRGLEIAPSGTTTQSLGVGYAVPATTPFSEIYADGMFEYGSAFAPSIQLLAGGHPINTNGDMLVQSTGGIYQMGMGGSAWRLQMNEDIANGQIWVPVNNVATQTLLLSGARHSSGPGLWLNQGNYIAQNGGAVFNTAVGIGQGIGPDPLDITRNVDGDAALQITNTNLATGPGGNAFADIYLWDGSATPSVVTQLMQTGSNNTSGIFVGPAETMLANINGNGLSLVTNGRADNNAPIQFWISGFREEQISNRNNVQVSHLGNLNVLGGPTCTNCGGFTPGSGDNDGYVQVAAWPIRMTFARPFAGTAVCTGSTLTTPGSVWFDQNTSTTIQIFCTSPETGLPCNMVGGWVAYHCMGI